MQALGEPLQELARNHGARIGAELEVKLEPLTSAMFACLRQGLVQVVARLHGRTAEGGPVHARVSLGQSQLRRGTFALRVGPVRTSELILDDGGLVLVNEGMQSRSLTAAEAAETIFARWLGDLAEPASYLRASTPDRSNLDA